MPVSHGINYQYSRAVLDTAVQVSKHGYINDGQIGNEAHWLGCGDHVPKECSGHYGWVTAIDIGTGRGFSGPECLHEFLVPRLAARFPRRSNGTYVGPVHYGEIKYIISDNELRDTRDPYNMKKQTGGDGPDHIHVSFTNNFSAHTSFLDEFVAWKAAGKPNVLTWSAGAAAVQMETDVAITALKDDWAVMGVKGTDGNLWLRFVNDDGSFRENPSTPGKSYNWTPTGVSVKSGVQMSTRNGSDIWVTSLVDNNNVGLITNPDIFSGTSVFTKQNIGGVGTSVPDILVKGDRVVLNVRGTDNAVYIRGFVSNRGWDASWNTAGGVAA